MGITSTHIKLPTNQVAGASKKNPLMWYVSNSDHIYARQLHNLWDSVQNENTGPLVGKLLRISRQQEQSIKSSPGPS